MILREQILHLNMLTPVTLNSCRKDKKYIASFLNTKMQLLEILLVKDKDLLIIINMVVDGLAIQGAKLSTFIVLT